MSYRSPDIGDVLSKLHELEFENISLQEENKRLKALLATETTRSVVRVKSSPPELLNAAMLEESNPVRRLYRKVKCSVIFGDHRWVCMADIKELFQYWKEPKNESSVPLSYFIKVQCRDCKMVGKEFNELKYRGRDLMETIDIMDAMYRTEREVLAHFREMEDEG